MLTTSNQATKDFSITPSEAMLLWGKSKRAVMWAIYTDKVNARQALNSDTWLVSFWSCCKLWGKPLDENLLIEIGMVWHG